MKTLLIATKFIFLFTFPVLGQNYIGLNQSKIIKKFGNPDEKGANYFVYFDQGEEGTNKYYFDENKRCTSFVLTRNTVYYEDYEKRLNKEFVKTTDYVYVSKSKHRYYQAEIIKSDKEFQICICTIDETMQTFGKDQTANVLTKENLVISNN